jgi:hypothetical protein
MAANQSTFFNTLADLADTGKRFQYRQGLDIRLMTHRKAAALATAKWHGDYIFAYDSVDDATTKAVERGLKIWRDTTNKSSKLYILSGFNNPGIVDIESIFFRIRKLMKYHCLPYLMRHENYKQSPFPWLYTAIARWCNQPALYKKKSFWEFLDMSGNERTARKARDLAIDYPQLKTLFSYKHND